MIGKMENHRNFNLRFYFRILTKIIREPGNFFSNVPADIGLKQPGGFLLTSSLICMVAHLASNMPQNPILIGSILFINAIGMTFIAAGIGYMLMLMFMGKQVRFLFFFSVYAFSLGVILLFSWLPFFVWMTEPWKWWLIGTGMTKALGFKWTQAALIIIISYAIIALFFWSLLPVVFNFT